MRDSAQYLTPRKLNSWGLSLITNLYYCFILAVLCEPLMSHRGTYGQPLVAGLNVSTGLLEAECCQCTLTLD